MLSLQGVWRTYDVGDSVVVALHDVTLDIGSGEFVAVMGPSGSGKSTLLQILGLLDRPTQGRVAIDGRDVGGLSDQERGRLRLETLGFVFQRFHLLPGLTALENVALPMEAAGAPLTQRYERAAELLTAVGLQARLSFFPPQLSGGQRQRVAIARALGNNPSVILADEPTGELHTEDTTNVIALLQRTHTEGRTVVVVTHDAAVAAAARRRIEIRDGRLVG